MHVQRNTFCSVSFLTRAIVVQQSHNKLCNWHADSSRRSIVQRSRERTTPRISSWTSLKYYIHFSFILKLIIFIYKQLKRPVAFSVVQHCWFTACLKWMHTVHFMKMKFGSQHSTKLACTLHVKTVSKDAHEVCWRDSVADMISCVARVNETGEKVVAVFSLHEVLLEVGLGSGCPFHGKIHRDT